MSRCLKTNLWLESESMVGQTNLILVFCGFMIFICFLHMTFLFAIFFSVFLLNVYTHMCLYLQWSTFRIYAMCLIPHIILTVLILGLQKAVCEMIL